MNRDLRSLSEAIRDYPEGAEKQEMLATFEQIKETAADVREQADVTQYLAGYDETGRAARDAQEVSDSIMSRFSEGVQKMTDRIKASGKSEEFGREPNRSAAGAMKEEAAKTFRDIASKGKAQAEKLQKSQGKEQGGVIDRAAHSIPVVKNVTKTLDASHAQTESFNKLVGTVWDGMKDLVNPKNKDKMKTYVELCIKSAARTTEYLFRTAVTGATALTQLGAPVISIATGTNINFVSKVAEPGLNMANQVLDKADKAIDQGGMSKEDATKLAGDLKSLGTWAQKELAPMLEQTKNAIELADQGR